MALWLRFLCVLTKLLLGLLVVLLSLGGLLVGDGRVLGLPVGLVLGLVGGSSLISLVHLVNLLGQSPLKLFPQSGSGQVRL